MITLETTSERISAWLRNEGRCAKGLSSLIMSCAIFASGAALSKTSFGAKWMRFPRSGKTACARAR